MCACCDIVYNYSLNRLRAKGHNYNLDLDQTIYLKFKGVNCIGCISLNIKDYNYYSALEHVAHS